VRGAERDERRTEERVADHAHARRSPGAHVLLVEDHLLRQRGAPPTVLLGPAQARPARAPEHALPLASYVEPLVLVSRPAPAFDRGEPSDVVLGQPIADLTPKGLVLVAEAEVHVLRPAVSIGALKLVLVVPPHRGDRATSALPVAADVGGVRACVVHEVVAAELTRPEREPGPSVVAEVVMVWAHEAARLDVEALTGGRPVT